MRLPRVRFTVRRMRIAVAIAALALGAEATRRRWASFRVMAKDFAQKEAQCRTLADSMRWASDRGPASEREEMKEKAAEYNRLADQLSTGRSKLEWQW